MAPDLASRLSRNPASTGTLPAACDIRKSAERPRTYDGSVVRPVVCLLCGLTGSGKTAYARRLEAQGCVRLSIDELVHARHCRYDVDYQASDYPRYYDEAVRELDRHLVELVEPNQSVVLDDGALAAIEPRPLQGARQSPRRPLGASLLQGRAVRTAPAPGPPEPTDWRQCADRLRQHAGGLHRPLREATWRGRTGACRR